MNGPQAFVSDFDGTLNFHNGAPIQLEDRETIEVFQGDGGLFGICTGRSSDALLMDTGGHITLDFAICDTGATIYDRNFNLIFERTLDRSVVRQLWETYHERSSWGALVSAAGGYFRVGTSDERGIIGVPSFEDIPHPIHGISFGTDTEAESASMAEEVNRIFKGVTVAHQNLNSIDIVPFGCSKGAGVERIRELFAAESVAAMGDSYNDLSMLQAANISYTFPSSPRELRVAADALQPSVGAALTHFMDCHTNRRFTLLAS